MFPLRYKKRLKLPPYMRIYLIEIMENLKLYEPYMLDHEVEQVLPSIEYLAPYAHAELVEHTILQKSHRTTRYGQHGLTQIGLKGKILRKANRYTQEKVEEKFPHIIQQNHLGTKILQKWGCVILFLIDHKYFRVKTFRNNCRGPFLPMRTSLENWGVKPFRRILSH